jgi:hypothetical protein
VRISSTRRRATAAAARSDAQRVGRLDVVSVVRLGGQLQDAAYAGGSLWVADYNGSVLRVDPAGRRVVERIPVAGNPAVIAADEAAVWVVCEGEGGACDWWLLRIDPRSGRIVASRSSNTIMTQLAVGAGGVWGRLYGDTYDRIGHIDSRGTVKGIVRVPGGGSLAAGPASVWSLGHDGTITEVDPATGEILHALRGAVSPHHDTPKYTVAADASGAWVVDSAEGTVLHVVAGHVVRRIPVAPSAGPIAGTDDAVWVATADALGRRNGLARIDPERGAVTARVDLGYHIPQAILSVGDTIWVVAGDGTATIVRED